MDTYLILEQGRVFAGKGFGAAAETVCELVFNSSMTGYTELLTDPSTAGKALTLTYPLVGNAGVCKEDFQSRRVWANALVVSQLSDTVSNFRGEEPLSAVLERFSIPGLQGIDIRSLVRFFRENRTFRCMITRDPARVRNLADTQTFIKAWSAPYPLTYKREAAVYNPDGVKTAALLDTGVRRDIIDALCRRGLRVKCYTPDTPAAVVLGDKPGGIVLAGGPGDPADYAPLLDTVRALRDSGLPLLALCLGHQLLALASGAKTLRLSRGHHGGNYPVRDEESGRVVISAQNHDYTVDGQSLDPSLCRISHRNVNDGTIEGLYYPKHDILSLQFNPEACGTARERQIIDAFAGRMEAR